MSSIQPLFAGRVAVDWGLRRALVPNLFMYFLEPHLATVPRWLGYPGVIGVFLIYGATGVVMVERYFYGPCVRRAMRELAFDVCLKCGYWLRGLDDSVERCPECGTLREPVPKTIQE